MCLFLMALAAFMCRFYYQALMKKLLSMADPGKTMSLVALLRVLLPLLVLTSAAQSSSDGQFGEWCIADEQTSDEALQMALDWTCGMGADCSKIQEPHACFFPNTLKDHASYAFNNYYQKFKSRGASCYFSAAAMVTDLDPSHDSCKFEFVGGNCTFC